MPVKIFTIGHSTHRQDRFIALLIQHKINAVYDVRSNPYSRLNSQFNRESLEKALLSSGIDYVFLGRELGARSDDLACYDGGKVQYGKLAETQAFRSGLRQVLRGAENGSRIALMCSEKEPLECHRTILVARHLAALDADVQHIHADGKLESHNDALNRLARAFHLPDADLFRSRDELLAEAYDRQVERIAYEIPVAKVASV